MTISCSWPKKHVVIRNDSKSVITFVALNKQMQRKGEYLPPRKRCVSTVETKVYFFPDFDQVCISCSFLLFQLRWDAISDLYACSYDETLSHHCTNQCVATSKRKPNLPFANKYGKKINLNTINLIFVEKTKQKTQSTEQLQYQRQ